AGRARDGENLASDLAGVGLHGERPDALDDGAAGEQAGGEVLGAVAVRGAGADAGDPHGGRGSHGQSLRANGGQAGGVVVAPGARGGEPPGSSRRLTSRAVSATRAAKLRVANSPGAHSTRSRASGLFGGTRARAIASARHSPTGRPAASSGPSGVSRVQVTQ